jgi:4'-phosphopantetheinyl transferase EntD
MVAVAFADAPEIRGVGVDVEQYGAVTPDLADRVMLPGEMQKSQAGGFGLSEYFSAKEAVFKACFPLHHEYFEFSDVEICVGPDGFRAHPVSSLASGGTISNGRGFTRRIEDHVLSIFFG